MMPIRPLLMRNAAAAAAPTYAVFSPEYRHPDIALSNGNLTITKNTTSGYAIVGAAEAKTASGLIYFEVTVNNLVTGDLMIGLGDYRTRMDNYLGPADGRSVGYTWDNRILYGNIDRGGGPGTFTTGDIISVAYEIASHRVWFRKNGGAWHNSGDPVAGTGGCGSVALDPAMPLIMARYPGTAVTANFGQNAWAYTPPTGYTGWTKNARSGARYWRLHQCTANTGGNYVLAEVVARLTSGGSNELSGVTASASSVWAPDPVTYAASKAIDGNAATIYHSANGAGTDAWWQVDLGAGVTKELVEWAITIRSDTLTYSNQFRVAYSSDATLWLPRMGFVAQTWPSVGSTRTFTFTG